MTPTMPSNFMPKNVSVKLSGTAYVPPMPGANQENAAVQPGGGYPHDKFNSQHPQFQSAQVMRVEDYASPGMATEYPKAMYHRETGAGQVVYTREQEEGLSETHDLKPPANLKTLKPDSDLPMGPSNAQIFDDHKEVIIGHARLVTRFASMQDAHADLLDSHSKLAEEHVALQADHAELKGQFKALQDQVAEIGQQVIDAGRTKIDAGKTKTAGNPKEGQTPKEG